MKKYKLDITTLRFIEKNLTDGFLSFVNEEKEYIKEHLVAFKSFQKGVESTIDLINHYKKNPMVKLDETINN